MSRNRTNTLEEDIMSGYKEEYKEIADWLTKVRSEATKIQSQIEGFTDSDSNEFLLEVYRVCDEIIEANDALKR
jgi:hypothetical protein